MSERDELVTAIMEHPWLDKSMFTGKSGDAFRGSCPSCHGRVIAGGHNSPSHAGHIADAILAAGYRRPRTVTTVEDVEALPEGTKLYSPQTTHSWELRDLSTHGGVRVTGTGGGYTHIRDFIKYEAPLEVLHEPEAGK